MKKILGSVWVLALLIAVPVIIFLPPFFDKYNVKLNSTNYKNGFAFFIYYIDLNSDGEKEKVICFQDSYGRFCAQYFSESKIAPVDQLNFPFNFYSQTRQLYFGDTDNNGFSEIYGFTKIADSLYINWFEPYPESNGVPKSKFITRMATFGEKGFDTNLAEVEFKDLNNDGHNDLVMPVVTGYPVKPRKIFVFDKENDSVYHSEFNGINTFNLTFADLDNDSSLEIIADNATSGNMKDSAGNLHIDIKTWLQVFNADLTPYTEPIPFSEGLVNRIQNFVVGEKKNKILTFHFDENRHQSQMAYLFDSQCNKIDSLVLPSNSELDAHRVFQYSQDLFLLVEGKCLTWVSSKPEVIKTRIAEIPEMSSMYGLFGLLDNKKQLIFSEYERNRLIILSDNFKHRIEIEFEDPIKSFNQHNIYGENEFYVLTDNAELQFQISKNNLYYLKYPVYLLIYATSVLFIWLIQGIRTKQLRERYELQNQVRELQLVSLRNQLDPHFIYNTFNSIASVIKQGRGDEAYDIFVLFSKMIRNNLDNSREIQTTLKNEIQFVKDYLLIQKFRFKDLFDYNIEIQRSVNLKVKLPKMLIQIHVENALKHGIRPKRSGGLLFIRLTEKQNKVNIEIEDNGIGRKKAGENTKNGTGIGLKTINQIVELSIHNSKLKIDQEIIDLTDENGNPAGTKVIVLLSY